METKPEDHKWDSFDQLVAHTTKLILEGMTKGIPLRSVVSSALATARDAKFKDDLAKKSEPAGNPRCLWRS